MTPEQMAQAFIAALIAGDIELVFRLMHELVERLRAVDSRIRSLESRSYTSNNDERDRGTRADLYRRYGGPTR